MVYVDSYSPRAAGAWLSKTSTGEEAYALFKQAMEASTGFKWLKEGDTVLLKLALNSANPYPATTDPWSLSSMIRLLWEKGAGRVGAGDSSGVHLVHWTETRQRGSTRKNCEKVGLMDVIRRHDAEAVFFEEYGHDAFKPVYPAGNHHWKEPVWITNAVDEADHIIYLCRVSSHLMGDITSGMKVGVGFLREDSRRAFHSGGDDFYAMYEEINHIPEISDKLRLVASSGRKVQAAFGPDNGPVTEPDYGLVFASEDILAHEMVAYAWLSWNREKRASFFDTRVTGNLTRLRSVINRGFVWYTWKDAGFIETPGMPFFVPGKIQDHPSIVNALRRLGGRPSGVEFKSVHTPAGAAEMDQYIRDRLVF